MMPTYGDTEKVSKEDQARIATAEQAHVAFLQTCRPEDLAELQRREFVALLAEAGGETPNTAKLTSIVKRAAEVSSATVVSGSPRNADEQQETFDYANQRGGAQNVAYSSDAVGYGPKAER